MMCRACGNCTIDHTKNMDDYIDEAEESPWRNLQTKNG
jgi:hypothetical protein